MDPENPISMFADTKLNSDYFFQILETHRKSCQREGRFDEAELTRLRILELRKYEEQAKKSSMQQRHQADQESLRNAHQLEMEKLADVWENDIMPKFEDTVKASVYDLQEKHRNEMESLKERQERDAQKIQAHPPANILDLKKRLNSLAATGEYSQAKKVKLKLLKLEEDWQNKQRGKLREKWDEQTDKLLMKQEREMQALLNKLDKARDLKKSQWQRETEILKKRYNNVRSGLENQHKIEKQRLQKEFSVKRQAMQASKVRRN